MPEKVQGKIPLGTVLSDSNKKMWIVGSFIEIDGSAAECYEAAEYNKGETPEHYPELIKVKPHSDKTLSSEINFFKLHANLEDIDKWIALKDIHCEYLSLPCYLGSARNVTIADINFDFLVLTKYGSSNLETVLSKHNNLFPKPTVLKIAYHILGVLEYLHNRNIIHGNIKACNIRINMHEKHVVYLLPQFHVADESDHNAMTFWSRFQHCTVTATTKRGDFESLLYNLIDWSGGILPWKDASPNEIKDMKSRAFEDPDRFLQDAFPSCECEDSSECLVARKCVASGKPVAASECLQAIRDLMGQLVFMDKTYDCTPDYKTIRNILKKRLLNMYHVPTSKLEFAVPTLIGDEDHDGKSSRAERKKIALYVPGLAVTANTLATIIAENCSNYNEVHTLDSKSCGVIDILQMNVTKRENVIRPAIRTAWEQDTQCLRTMVVELWRSKGIIQPVSYKIWKRTKGREKNIKRNTTGASMGDEKKAAVRNRSESIVSKNADVVITQSRHPMGLKRQQNQQRKRYNESSNSSSSDSSRSSKSNSWPIKRFKSDHSGARSSVSSSESDENDQKDYRSASAPELDEDDREDARPGLNDVSTPTPSTSNNRHSIEYYISSNEAADESEELFSEETVLKTTQQTGGTVSQAIERRRSVFVDDEPWSDTYEWMNAWLEFREQSLIVVGLISSEPGEKIRQKFQVRVLRDGFSLSLQRLRRLMNALVELPSDSEDVQKFNRIQQRWLNQLVFLEKSSRQLGDASLSPVHDVLHDQEIVVWLIEELENISEKLFISTDRESLRQQREHYQTAYQRIINKEVQVKMLLKEGCSALKRSQNHKNITIQQLFLDVTKSLWNCLKKCSFKNHEKMETYVDYSEKYYQTQNLLSCWLTEVENKLECLKPSSLKEIKKILQELSSLSNMVHEKSGDIEQYINLGHTFINACDIDKDEVLKNELIAMNDRWNKLNNKLLERRQSLKDMDERFDNIRESLLELKDKIQQCQQELASYCASGGAAKDLTIHNHLMELHDKIGSTREQVNDLVAKSGQKKIDASFLVHEIVHVAASIESLKIKSVDTCKKILESRFRSIGECDDIMRLLEQISKLKVVLLNVESVLGSVADTAMLASA